MTTNLEKNIIEDDNQRILSMFARCKELVESDADITLNQARKALEVICERIVNVEKIPITPVRGTGRLKQLIDEINNREILPREIFSAFKTVQIFGNIGSHETGSKKNDIIINLAKSALFALSALVIWYLRKYSVESNFEDLDLQRLKLSQDPMVSLSFKESSYISADEEYQRRQNRLKQYSFEESGRIMRREERQYLEQPKRDYDEVCIEIKIRNQGKRAIERFRLSLENAEIGYRHSWPFASADVLFPGMEIQFPGEPLQLQIPTNFDVIDLKWSVFMDNTLPYTGEYQIRRRCATNT
jgi:hypothetical protein